MENYENVFQFLEYVDELGSYDFDEDSTSSVSVPQQGNIYLRDIIDPFEFYTEGQFTDRYRFSKDTVLNIIVPLINGGQHSTMRGLPIPVHLQVAICLRFYATGSFQTVCGDLHYISQPTVSRIIKNISAQLASRVQEFVKFPDSLLEVAAQFEALPNTQHPGLKHIIGAIDCTHIKIKRPRRIAHSEVYINRKGRFSINVQAIVGPTMKIYDLVARWPGSSHDSRIFRSSRIHALLEAGETMGILVGDSGYRSAHYMLTPFVNPSTRAEQRYNEVQIRTRNVVERVFGVLKKRYECLRVGLGTKLSTTTNIIVSCAVLHNISIDANEDIELDANYREDAATPAPQSSQPASGLAFRSNIVQQFYNF